jgi:hypothetical protein
MSRNENENIDSLDVPKPGNAETEYYLSNGATVTEPKCDPPLIICGKVLQSKVIGNYSTYYVLCNKNNQFFDPQNSDIRYKTNGIWRFRRVDKDTFELYVKFLKQKYQSLLRQAERGL